MTELLTNNLPLLACAPNGVQKLRQLVFELAASGKLVDASNSTKRVPLGEVASFVMGQAPPGNECNKNGDGYVFVKTGEFGVLYPEVREWTTKPLKHARAGDVLICVVGATVGKLNLGIDCAIGRSVAAIRPKVGLVTKYLYFSLMPFTLKLREQSRGSAQGVIGKSELSAVEIRFPTECEQHRIIAKVDELLALCDRLETQQADAEIAHAQLVQALLNSLTQAANSDDFTTNWQRLAEHFHTLFTTESSIDALKQTLLQLAVMGKLVTQDPNEESASELLKKIVSNRQRLFDEGALKKQKDLTEICDEEKPFILPQGWEWARMSSFSELKSGLAYKSEIFSDGGDNQVIRMGNVRPGILRLEKNPVFISDDLARDTSAYSLAVGDIVLTMTGTKGKQDYMYSVLIEEKHLEKTRLYLNQRLCIVRAQFVNQQFLALILQDERLLDQIFRSSTGTANQANIGMNALSNWLLPIPPLSEQSRIVKKVAQIMSICEEIKIRVNNSYQMNDSISSTLICEGLV